MLQIKQLRLNFQGKDGPAAYDTLTTIKSVKPWFQDDSDLLRLMQRHGHTLFLRNNRDESKEVFSFIKSVTDEDSEINQDVRTLQILFDLK